MNQPLVTCVMLTRNRYEMAARAIRCFEAQTWKNRRLLVLDDSDEQPTHEFLSAMWGVRQQWSFHRMNPAGTLGVGCLRQKAVVYAQILWPIEPVEESDIICHWDDDDVSSPRRIEHQLQLMREVGGLQAPVAAYDRMLFYDQPNRQAWEYRGGPLGTSLMYPRELAIKHPFPSTDTGEDMQWLSQLRIAKVPIVTAPAYDSSQIIPLCEGWASGTPQLIAGIHRTNHTSSAYSSERMCGNPQHWARKPEFDLYCAERFV